MFTINAFTPVFNTRNFLSLLSENGAVGAKNHMRILETIIFPGTKVQVHKIENSVAMIQCEQYQSSQTFFIPESFLQKSSLLSMGRVLPNKKTILFKLKNFPKLPYLLGGNTPFAVDMKVPLCANPFSSRYKRLYGVDCSGLIYYVCNGLIPRNSIDLKNYGKQVSSLQPLDMIWFKGHVLFYIGNNQVIESREKDGVIISSLDKRLKQIPKDHLFIRLFD